GDAGDEATCARRCRPLARALARDTAVDPRPVRSGNGAAARRSGGAGLAGVVRSLRGPRAFRSRPRRSRARARGRNLSIEQSKPMNTSAKPGAKPKRHPPLLLIAVLTALAAYPARHAHPAR